MQRLDISRLYTNEIGSGNSSYNGVLLLNIVLLEIALYRWEEMSWTFGADWKQTNVQKMYI